MTKDQLVNVLPIIREAVAIATGGEIETADYGLVIRIYCDTAQFAGRLERERELTLRYGAPSAALAPGCCSAISPCAHQRSDPTTLCDICRQAAVLESLVRRLESISCAKKHFLRVS